MKTKSKPNVRKKNKIDLSKKQFHELSGDAINEQLG